jgi:hypothetical protein
MQKIYTQKALLLFTLLFMVLAAASFAAFRETEQVYTGAEACMKYACSTQESKMLWEVIFRPFLSLMSF